MEKKVELPVEFISGAYSSEFWDELNSCETISLETMANVIDVLNALYEADNKLFGRWVNKGARGIAVFDDEHNGNYRLKHYFDISDTHESRFARNPGVWQMRLEYETAVIESLENSFGDLDDNSTMAAALISAAKNAVEDNMTDYLRDLLYCREDSFLEELDDFNVEVEYREALQSSVAYMLMTRCGIDSTEHLESEDFRFVTDFNTRSTVNALGLATSDIAEMCLREIAATVRNLQLHERSKNRTFANMDDPAQNITDNQNVERSAEHDRSVDISDGGRLQPAEPDRPGGSIRSPWQIRITPKEIPETAPPRPVHELSDGGDAERAPDRDRADGERAHGTGFALTGAAIPH